MITVSVMKELNLVLVLAFPFISKSCIKIKTIKIKIFIFTFLCATSKGFMKAFKTFIKHFEAPQSVKMKI